MNFSQRKVLDYFNSLESRFGYKYITYEARHFGFYPRRKEDISEKKAQELMQDLIFENLRVKSNSLILDAGCGMGVVACYLAEKYRLQIIGIDINKLDIEIARKRAKRKNFTGRVSFEIADYSKTKFANNYFDAIYTIETLCHSPDVRKTLNEFYRILKPGGEIALFEYTIAEDEEFNQREKKMLDLGIEKTAAMSLRLFRHNKFTNLIEQARFVKVKEQNITENFKPSANRLRHIARVPYTFIKLLRLQKYFVNAMIAIEWSKFADKGLWRYCILTGRKP